MTPFDKLRHDMVRHQIIRRGVKDVRVLDAMRKVPRERFVTARWTPQAYADCPLPMEHDQTISQPYIVAWMAELLRLQADSRVLEIGTGSGYAAAILAEIAAQVFSVERHRELVDRADQILGELGYANVHVRCADGCLGWPEEAPFDGITVAAAAAKAPPALLAQLAIGGRLVIPLGKPGGSQQLTLIERISQTTLRHDALGCVRFVPLLGGNNSDNLPEIREG